MRFWKKKNLFLLLTLLAVGLMTGCASLPVSQRSSSVESLLYRIHTGDVAKAVDLTYLPFLLDGEILTTERDAELLWTNLKEVPGFLESPEILSLKEAYSSDYVKFRESAEMRVYFDRALPENASLAEIKTSAGSFLLLLSGKKIGLPVIAGLKGPLR